MQRLNIPLKTGTQTTRHRRRVVWPLVGFLIVFIVALALSRIVLGATTLQNIAPEAIFVVDLSGPKALSQLAELLGNTPVLPGRPLTMESIAPFIRGEAAIVFKADGDRLFVFRGQVDEPIKTRWSSLGIVVLEADGATVIATEPIDISGWSFAPRLHLRAVIPGFAGQWRSEGQSHPVFESGSCLALKTPKNGIFQQKQPQFPGNLIAWVPFSSGTNKPSSILTAYLPLMIADELNALLKNASGDVGLTKLDDGLGFRLVLNQATESQILAEILQKAAAIKSVNTSTVELSDGSFVDELRTDPDRIQVSVAEENGGTVIKASHDGVELTAVTADNQTIITNRTELLDLTDSRERGAIVWTDQIADLASSALINYDPSIIWLKSAEKITITTRSLDVCW